MGKQGLAGLAQPNIYRYNKIDVEEITNRFARLQRKRDFLL